jgi:hypothetical protein
MRFASVGILGCVLLNLVIPVGVQAVSINERAGNHFRTAANNQETILNENNVNAEKFGLLHIHDFDAKVETQPLIVEKGTPEGDDLVIVTTMKNDVIGINARTNARVYTVTENDLGKAINTVGKDGTQDMDMWKHTPMWGISATPIIDPATNTLFVAAWVQKNNNDYAHRDYKLFILDSKTGQKKHQPVRIFGQSQEGNGCWFNDADAVNSQGMQYTYPKLRAALALTGNNGLVLAFASNGEKPRPDKRDNPHGFVVAYDTRGLQEVPGFSREPAMFCTTAFNSWGAGIWQAGGAPVTDGDMIYVATSNGTSNNGDVDLSESMIKLRFTPSVNGARPVLAKQDFYKAFMDEKRSGKDCFPGNSTDEAFCGRAVPPGGGKSLAAIDWDFGSAGPMLFPESKLLLQGTKDGIIYSLNKDILGKTDRFGQLMSSPPLVASYFGGQNQDLDRAKHLNRSIPCVPESVDAEDHKWFKPCGDPENGKMHHIHSLALVQKDASSGIVYVWGENANLKAYNFSTASGAFPTFFAEGDTVASVDTPLPGGMPGGLLMVSGPSSTLPNAPESAIDTDKAIVWAVYSKCGDANKGFADGELIAYKATPSLPGDKLKQLYSTAENLVCKNGRGGGLGRMSRMIPPVVANGKVYVMIYRTKMIDTPNNRKIEQIDGSQLKVFGLK